MNDDYQRWLEENKKRESTLNRVSRKIKPWHIILIIAIFILGNYLNKTGQVKSQWFWGFVILISVVTVFLLYRESGERRLIPEHIIKEICQRALERKRQQGIEIPFDCKIHVLLQTGAIYETDLNTSEHGVIKREVGFEIVKKGYRRTGVISVQPYTGDILDIRWEKLGYSGKESKDRTIVPVALANVSNPSKFQNIQT